MKIYFIYSKKYKVEEYYHPEKSEWFDIEDGHPFILDDSMYCCIQFQFSPETIKKRDKASSKGKIPEVTGNKNLLHIYKFTYL